jgi:hypothetical protein
VRGRNYDDHDYNDRDYNDRDYNDRDYNEADETNEIVGALRPIRREPGFALRFVILRSPRAGA